MLDRRHLLASLASLPVAACASMPARSGQPRLTVATFNIWHNQGDWAARLPLIVETLRAMDADVIGLQEVLQDAAVGLPNQAATIAEALGYRHVFCSVDGEDRPRRYGNAILTRLPIVEQDWTRLEPLDDYRTALRVRVRLGDRLIDVVDTHLHHTPEGGTIRARQIYNLLSWIGDGDTPLIVLGDLNAPLENPEMAPLRGPRFASALASIHPDQAARTTLNPAKGHRETQIDHILFETAAFTPTAAAISGDRPTNGEYPSDHFAVSATLALKV